MCPFCGESRLPLIHDRTVEAMCPSCGVLHAAMAAPELPAEASVSLESVEREPRAIESRDRRGASSAQAPCPCEDSWPHPSVFLG